MSDDKKINTDDIDLSFDEDFESEVEDVLSEKTTMTDIHDPSEAPTNAGIHEKTIVTEDASAQVEDYSFEDQQPLEVKTEMHESSDSIEYQADKNALDFSEGDLMGSSEEIQLEDLPQSIDGGSEKTELFGEVDDNSLEKNNKLQDLFQDMKADLSSNKPSSLSDELGMDTELVDSSEEQASTGPMGTPEKTRNAPKVQEPLEVSQSKHPKKSMVIEPSKSSTKKASRRRKPKVNPVMVGVVLGCGAILFAAYSIFYTPSGLFGFSLKGSSAKKSLEKQATQEIKLTPELLQSLEQKYEQAMALTKVDQFESYQKAIKLFSEILDSFPNHPNASSAIAISTLLGGRGYLDQNAVANVQKWVRHAETISPNTKETLHAKIRLLIFQDKIEEAQARLLQLEKFDEKQLDTLLLFVEFYLLQSNFEQALVYMERVREVGAEQVRVQYIEAMLAKAQNKKAAAKTTFEALMTNNQHLASAIEFYEIQHQEKNPQLIANLQLLLDEKGKLMAPFEFSKGQKVLSDAYMAKGDRENSIKALELAVQKMPLMHGYAYLLGNMYEQIKLNEKASQYYRQAHQIESENPQYKIAYGRSLRLLGKPKEAEDLLQEAITKFPEIEDGVVEYAKSRIDQGFFNEVADYLTGVFSDYPHFAHAKTILGDLHARQNQNEEAKKIYLEALKSAKTNEHKALANRSLGILSTKLEQWSQAQQYLNASNSQNPKNTHTLFALGDLYLKQKKYQQAEISIIDALNLDDTNLQARGVLAKIYYERGKIEEAKKTLQEILVDDVKNVGIRVSLAEILISEKNYAEAIKELDQAYLYDSAHYPIFFNLGIAMRESGRLDEALRSFSRSIEVWPQSYLAYYHRGLTFIARNDIQNATKDMEKSMELNPQWVDSIRALANYYFEVGLYAKSGEYYKKILEILPRDQESLYYLGRAHFQDRMPEQALEYYSRLIAANPKHAKGLFEIGVVLEDNEDFRQALQYYQRSLQLDRNSPDTHYRLGFVYKNLGMRRQASASFQMYLKLRPDALDKADVEDEIYRLETAM